MIRRAGPLLIAALLFCSTGCKNRQGCGSDADCKGDRVCEGGKCVRDRDRATPPRDEQPKRAAQPPRGPRAVTVTVRLGASKNNGLPWDIGGDMGDPYIVVGGASYKTQGGLRACKNAAVCHFQVITTWPARIEVWDQDLSVDDFAGAADCSPGRTCDVGQATVTVR